ncbi:MAG: transcriptional activator protein [Geminicoccaceae bacterium]|nr:transcriptional activator protein [Geminicoccaceae bacterium]
MIRIRTLGGLSVEGPVKTQAGRVTQPRRLAVLALIARAGERGITRDKLVATLWPDADEDVGRKSLSQALYALRRDLDADELVLGVQELKLNLDVATCDVIEFETALDERALERAAEVYGGPFLDGFRLPGVPEFDRWVEDERRSLAQRHVEALERLARRVAERDDAAGAAEWWRRIADLDPLNARIAAELMRSLVAAGDPGGALKHARIYEALLAQELDLEPDRQVVELAQRIRREASAAPESAPRVAAPDPPSAPEVAPASAPSVALPESTAPLQLPTVAKPRRNARLIAAITGSIVVVAAVGGWIGLRALRTTDPPVVAVGRIVDYRTTIGREAEAVGDMLGTNLARVRGLRVLSGARLYEVVAQLDDPKQPQNTLVARAAERAGATEVLEGGLHALTDGQLMLELRRIDLKTGAVRDGYRLEGADVYALVSRATEVLSRSLDHPSGRLDPGDVSTRSLVAYRFYEEGLRSYARADYRGADRLLQAAVAEDSSFAMAAFYLLMARVGLGAPEGDNTWERVLRLADRAPERERLLIKATWAANARDPALEPLADSLATLYPAEVDGPFLQGIARYIDADFAGAIGHMRRVLAMDSLGLSGGSPRCRACDAAQTMISAYVALDSLGTAERMARDYVRQQPRAARAWGLLAGVLFAGDRLDEAAEAHRTARSINPVDQYDRIFAPAVRLRGGNFDEGDRQLRALMNEGSASETSEGRWVLTISLRYQGRWREALGLAREAVAALPARDRSGPAARGHKMHEALILQESGRPRDAAAAWDWLARNALPAEPLAAARMRAFAFVMLADAQSAAGDTAALAAVTDSAAKWATEARHRRGAYLVDHARGLLRAARGDTSGAIETLERAIYSPTEGFTRTNRALGALYLARRRPADAVRVLGGALRYTSLESGSLYVTHTELHELLARAFDELGQADSAAVHYRYVASALEKSDSQARPRHAAALQRLVTLGRAR